MNIFRTLFIKLCAAILTTIAFTVTIGIVLFYRAEYRSHTESIVAQAKEDATIALAVLEHSMMHVAEDNVPIKGIHHTQDILDTISATTMVNSIAITDHNARIALSSGGNDYLSYLDSGTDPCNRCHQQKPRQSDLAFKYITPNGIEVLRIVMPIFNKTKCISCHDEKVIGLVVSDMDTSVINAHIQSQIFRLSLLSLSIFLVISLTLLLINNKIVIRPIKDLVHGAEQIIDGNYDVVIPEKSKDELGFLAGTFNRMSERIKSANDSLKQWNITLEEEVVKRTDELYQANRQLEREQHQTEAMTHSLLEGILSVNLLGKIVLANEQAADVFSLSREDMIGKSLQDIIQLSSWHYQNPEEVERMFFINEEPAREGCGFYLEQIQPRRRTFKMCRSRIVGEGGTTYGWVFSFHDISRERELDEIKTNLIAIVSHELRTPLTSIKGALSLLSERKNLTAPERLDFQQIALTNTDRLIDLINNLLDMAKIESGKLFCDHGAFFFKTLLEKCRDNVSALAKRNDIRIEIQAHDALDEACGDASKLEQVITNLLSNAVKFSPKNSVVTAMVSQRDNDYVVSVSDKGIGISEEEKEKIFEKFYQVDMTSVRTIGGSGLGLCICKAIVESHGGTLWVESSLGAGSTFYFSIPKSDYAKTALRPETIPKDAISYKKMRQKVLIVEDEEAARKILTAHLKKKGVEVLEASSAKEALALARKKRPDCITVDVMLPDIDGFDLATVLKYDPITRKIPIVFLTVVADEGESRGRKLGAAAYFTKPIRYERVVEKIESLLGAFGYGIAGRHILLVDDEEDLVTMLENHLSKKGYQVTTAFSGQEALARLEERPPDLLVLDLRMPDVSGYDILKRIKSDARYSTLPVIVITASEERHSRDVAMEMGAASFLRKPLSPEILRKEIDKLIH